MGIKVTILRVLLYTNCQFALKKEAYLYFCIKHTFISYQNFAISYQINVISFKICVSKHKHRNEILLDVLRRTEHLKRVEIYIASWLRHSKRMKNMQGKLETYRTDQQTES